MKSENSRIELKMKKDGKGSVLGHLAVSYMRYRNLFLLVLLALLLAVASMWLWQTKREKEKDPLLPVLAEPTWLDKKQTDAYFPQDGLTLTRIWDQQNRVPILRDYRQVLRQGEGQVKEPLRGLTIFLDAGHGGYDPGTIWPVQNEYEKAEKDVTLAIVNRLKPLLESLGAHVILTREDDQFVSLFTRTAYVAEYLLKDYLQLAKKQAVSGKNGQNQAVYHQLQEIQKLLSSVREQNTDKSAGLFGGVGASLEARLLYDLQKQYQDCIFLSIHVNAAQREEVGGTQVYFLRNGFLHRSQNVSPDSGEYRQALTEQREAGDNGLIPLYPLYLNYNDAERELLALALYHSLDERVPRLRTREAGSVLDQNFAVLRTCNLPSVLFETGFITNAEDREFLWSEVGQKALAESIAAGLAKYKRDLLANK